MNIVVLMILAGLSSLGLVYLLEMLWLSRRPGMEGQWAKGPAMRFMWAAAGVLVVLGQFPLGIMLGVAGLPVCLAHLRLVDRQPVRRISPSAVADEISETARASFRHFMDRTRRIGPHQ